MMRFTHDDLAAYLFDPMGYLAGEDFSPELRNGEIPHQLHKTERHVQGHFVATWGGKPDLRGDFVARLDGVPRRVIRRLVDGLETYNPEEYRVLKYFIFEQDGRGPSSRGQTIEDLSAELHCSTDTVYRRREEAVGILFRWLRQVLDEEEAEKERRAYA